MNVDNSAYVFRRSDGSPVIIAYKRIDTKYLTFVLHDRKACTFLASFADLMDVIPIHAKCVCKTLLLRETLDETLQDWKFELTLRLNTYGEVKMNFKSLSPPPRR